MASRNLADLHDFEAKIHKGIFEEKSEKQRPVGVPKYF